MRIALFVLMTSLALAEEPVKFAWKFQEGQSIVVKFTSRDVVTTRTATMTSVSHREYTVHAALEIQKYVEGEEGKGQPATGVIRFISIEGKLTEDEAPIVEVEKTEKDLADTAVAFSFHTDGRLQVDAEALRKIHLHLPEAFEDLFLKFPDKALAVNDGWTQPGKPCEWRVALKGVEEREERTVSVFVGRADPGVEAETDVRRRAKGYFEMKCDAEAGYVPEARMMVDVTWLETAGAVTSDVTLNRSRSITVVRQMR